MKQKDFVINLAVLLGLNLLVKPFWVFGIDAGVQNSVGAAQYGAYFAVFNFTFLFNMLLDLGITNFNNRNIARHTQLLSKHLSSILTIKLLLGLVYLLFSFGAGSILGYQSLQLKILFWTAVNQFLNSLVLYLRSNLSALFLFKTDSLLSVLDRLVMIAVCSLLLWGNVTRQPFRIEWFVYAQTFAYLVSAGTALAILAPKAPLLPLRWNTPFAWMILRKSFPFAILHFLMSFYNRIDSVMIERILPSSIADFETGVYASAFRFLDALVMISYLFSVILLPMFSKMLKEKENLLPIVKTAFSLLLFFSVTASVVLISFRFPLLELIYKNNIPESARVLQFLLPCIIPVSFTYIFGTLLTANGNMGMLNRISLAGIAVNLAVNFILIPRWHAVGAAVASLSTQSVVAAAQLFAISRQIGFPLRRLPWIRNLIYCVLLIPMVCLIQAFPLGRPLLSVLLTGICSCGLAWGCGLFSLKEMARLKIMP